MRRRGTKHTGSRRLPGRAALLCWVRCIARQEQTPSNKPTTVQDVGPHDSPVLLAERDAQSSQPLCPLAQLAHPSVHDMFSYCLPLS